MLDGLPKNVIEKAWEANRSECMKPLLEPFQTGALLPFEENLPKYIMSWLWMAIHPIDYPGD
jgi:hypothetical protein